jgi:hypothetical protein
MRVRNHTQHPAEGLRPLDVDENCLTCLDIIAVASGLTLRFLVPRLLSVCGALSPSGGLGAVVASITEIERAKMVTTLAAVIGKEEANVLATALNLDGQLATHEEVQALSMELRNSMRDLKDETRAMISSEVGALRLDVNVEFALVRSEMKAEFALVRAETDTLRTETRAEFALVRSEIGLLRTEFTSEVRKQTRQLFVALLTVVATIFGLMAGLLGIAGKL